MRLHNNLRQRTVAQARKAGQPEEEAIKRLERQQAQAKKYCEVVCEFMQEVTIPFDIHEELMKGNPNVERLVMFKEGYDKAIKQFLKILIPDKEK